MRYRKLLKKWEKSHVVTTHFQLLLQNQWVAPFLRVNIRHNLLHINMLCAMCPSKSLICSSPTAMRTFPPRSHSTAICYASRSSRDRGCNDSNCERWRVQGA